MFIVDFLAFCQPSGHIVDSTQLISRKGEIYPAALARLRNLERARETTLCWASRKNFGEGAGENLASQ